MLEAPDDINPDSFLRDIEKIGKGRFAQRLSNNMTGNRCPSYIKEAIEYVVGRCGISRPFIEGQGGTPLPGQGDPMKAGEFVLGYVNELGDVARGPGPEEFLRRCGPKPM